ncbi:MAG: hypothetical protein ACJAVK_000114 [Akkermansiaceae bacterium]
MIVADGYDRALGSNEGRRYPGGLGFVTQFHHTNFKLSSTGEEIILSRESQSDLSIVSPASNWNYFRQKFTILAHQGFFLRDFFFDVNGGAAVYLNGEEVGRRNLPAGPLNSETLAMEALSPFAQVERVAIQMRRSTQSFHSRAPLPGSS